MDRPEHEILALGDGARGVLSDETFNALFKQFSDLCLQTIVSSQPHEVKVREFEYAKLQALIGFSQYLASFVEAAENIKNKEQPRDDDAD